MRPWLIAVMLCASFVAAQESKPASSDNSAKGEVTVRGCVSRASGDYILFKQDPGVSYELQAPRKIRLRKYLGQRVEVTGLEGPTLSTSSDATNKMGSASSVTITISSIRAIDKECPAH